MFLEGVSWPRLGEEGGGLTNTSTLFHTFQQNTPTLAKVCDALHIDAFAIYSMQV